MRPVFSFSGVTIIDCGATRTALGIFKLNRGRLHCVDFAAVPFFEQPAGDDLWLENTATALATLNSARRWPARAVLVLPAQVTLTKQLKVPLVDKAKRGKIIRFEAGQAIPHALNDVVWDSVISGRQDGAEEVMLVAAKREVVDRLCVAAQAGGFRPCKLLPASLATLAGFRLAQPDCATPSLVLNLGGRSATLLQVEGKNRFVARTLVVGAGAALPQSAEIQNGDRLVQEVNRSILHFGRQCGMGNPERVFLTGAGAQLAELAGLLSSQLKIPAEIVDASGAVESGGKNGFGPALTDLIGAASIVLRRPQPAMDLLPPGPRRSEELRRRQPWLIAAALLAVGAFWPPILHHWEVARVARVKIAALESTLAPLRARELRNRASLVRLEQLGTQMAWLGAVNERRTGWLRLLAGFQEELAGVEDAWLDQLQILPPADGAPVKLAVSGCMLAPTGPETIRRVRELLAGVGGLPSVTGVESERFDPSRPGLLRFDFVLATDPARQAQR